MASLHKVEGFADKDTFISHEYGACFTNDGIQLQISETATGENITILKKEEDGFKVKLNYENPEKWNEVVLNNTIHTLYMDCEIERKDEDFEEEEIEEEVKTVQEVTREKPALDLQVYETERKTRNKHKKRRVEDEKARFRREKRQRQRMIRANRMLKETGQDVFVLAPNMRTQKCESCRCYLCQEFDGKCYNCETNCVVYDDNLCWDCYHWLDVYGESLSWRDESYDYKWEKRARRMMRRMQRRQNRNVVGSN